MEVNPLFDGSLVYIDLSPRTVALCGLDLWPLYLKVIAYARSLGNYNYEIGLQLKAEVARPNHYYYSLAETPPPHILL